MGEWLDDVARAMARGATRKEFLKLLGASAVGLVVTRPAEVEAKEKRPKVCFKGGPPCERCCFGAVGTCTTSDDDALCGSGGKRCQNCLVDKLNCINGQCVCTVFGNCQGCCDGDKCKDGTSDKACGKNGSVCARCAKDEECKDGECVPKPCNVFTCRKGCCSIGEDRCVPGTADNNCGFLSGTTCNDCTAQNKKCCERICTDVRTSNTDCGRCGHACKTDETCVNGQCCPSGAVCGSGASATCCFFGTCVNGTCQGGVCTTDDDCRIAECACHCDSGYVGTCGTGNANDRAFVCFEGRCCLSEAQSCCCD
ncbi:MAG: hypothetical protein IT307_19420 [Chloroflexi bacterium]|nr:hypothetical protein [Chloroflexota bacterium]